MNETTGSLGSLRALASELRADLLSAKAIPAVSAGFTSGLGLLVAQIAFGSLIFSGTLAPWSSQGVGLVLFGNFAACLIFALAGGFRGTIAGLSPALVIVMATLGASMDAEGEARFVTAAGALVISAVATGVGFFLLGRFRLANLVRFIPYPVTAGFVAGIGAAVCLGALSLMGAEADVRSIPTLLEPSVLLRWGPGAAYGIALYLAIKRWGHPLILPVSVVLAVGAYHLVLAATGMSGDEARAAGLLLTSTADGGLWPPLGPADLAKVEWAALAAQIPLLLTLILIAFICVIMNVSGLELAANQELDWDREFRVTGVASVIAGLGGGTVATIVVPASLRSKLLGASTRLTGLVAAGVIGAALLLGDGMLEIVPARLVGGILIFAGLGMLDEGSGEEPRAPPLVGVRDHPADRARDHGVRTDRGRGRRHGRDPGVLRPAPQPRGPDSGALHGVRPGEQHDASGPRSRHPDGDGRAGTRLPAARLPVLRQRLLAGRSPQAVLARG